jgi:hypothetical protein
MLATAASHYLGGRSSSLSADTYGIWQIVSSCRYSEGKQVPGCSRLAGQTLPGTQNSADRPSLLPPSADCEMRLILVSLHRQTLRHTHLRKYYRWRQNGGHQPHQHDGPPAVADGAERSGSNREHYDDEPVTVIVGDGFFCCGQDVSEKPAASIFTIYRDDGGNRFVETATPTRLHVVTN